MLALERRGAEVQAFESGQEVLNALTKVSESTRPDVLICDIGMPEMDGYTVIRRLRAMAETNGLGGVSKIPAIALTAYAQPEDQERAMLAGFQMHFAKPLDPADLVRAIATLTR
jgi:CheY-like chemotaxis protein